jgi:hypothetical protein
MLPGIAYHQSRCLVIFLTLFVNLFYIIHINGEASEWPSSVNGFNHLSAALEFTAVQVVPSNNNLAVARKRQTSGDGGTQSKRV